MERSPSWFMALDWKSSKGQTFVGSNPTLSAKEKTFKGVFDGNG